MRKYSVLLTAVFTLVPLHAGIASILNTRQDNETAQLVKFLVSDKILTKGKNGQSVPLSYYIGNTDEVALYFGDYICAKDKSCDVTDSVYSNPFAILGKGLPPQPYNKLDVARAQAQIERTDMKYGADIYDAATWQIALALAAKNGYLEPEKARTLIAGQLQNIMHKDNRATADSFKYGYQNSITDPAKAFTFRMIATDFFNKDPFMDGKYKGSLHWDYDPEKMSKEDPAHHPADFFKYTSTWSDWKPIIGENAWAQLIGPLQADYLANNGKISDATLQNAMNTLDAFSAMQAGIGAFYYAPGGSQGNQGPIPQGEISLENNFSLLGGLQIFKRILTDMPQTADTTKALEKINVMLNGGTTVNGYQTLGLLSFMYNGAFNASKGIFYTHGTATDPRSQNDWQPDTSDDAGATAIDVNTWGMSALGVETVDSWFGEGTALKIWTTVRNKGGYYHDNELWGVGYTLNNKKYAIMSTEWTAGAISAVNSLIHFYSNKIDTTDLQNDLHSMQQGIMHLRNDQYLNYNFDNDTPKRYFVKVADTDGYAYLYASQRSFIPFGWNANTLPSTTSNAWVIMNKFNFNPFQYQGNLAGENYAKPAKVDIGGGGGDNPPAGDTLPVKVTTYYNSGDLDKNGLQQIAIAYNTTGLDSDWRQLPPPVGPDKDFKGVATFPKGTKGISISFKTNAWYGACKLLPTTTPVTKICKDSTCTSLKTITAKWSKNGTGACNLE